MSDDVRNTLTEREGRYGNYADVAGVSQDLKSIILAAEHDREQGLPHVVHESLDMICNKIARIVNGDPMYIDSWHDIAGYAQLVIDWIEAQSPERIKADMLAHMQAHVDAVSGTNEIMRGTLADFEERVIKPKLNPVGPVAQRGPWSVVWLDKDTPVYELDSEEDSPQLPHGGPGYVVQLRRLDWRAARLDGGIWHFGKTRDEALRRAAGGEEYGPDVG